ncbi:universal stress protein [Desulfoferrobacter suflitae]|uniref:universal stress protein n=1 Tax=Desulfoferrobacter suflitae TaxID=2865782 RepID=UPI00216463F5|nr:universal stress protein [Desulfoferrobacter suflitae]MCK8603727.1 universal stress protein [Desulfoferrobacter suflitae]
MEKHFLITVGDDPQYLYGAKFMAFFFKDKTGLKLNLLYMASRFDCICESDNPRLHEINARLAEIYRKKGELALKESRRILQEHGFSSRQISTKVFDLIHDVVQNTVEYARVGAYNALLLCRRGCSVFAKTFRPIVSEAIIDLQIDFPVWIIRRPQPDRKNVLLCVDGSEASLHAADHVAFMLEQQEQHKIILFHLRREESGDPETVLDQARQRLTERIESHRIDTLLIQGGRVSETILNEATREGFAAVAIGRRGQSAGSPAEKHMGSTCINLLHNLEGAALWVKW